MAAVSGLGGSVTYANGTVTHVKSWTVNSTCDGVDVTAFTNATRARVAGMKDWSGSYEGTLEGAAAMPIADSIGAATFTLTGAVALSGSLVVTSVDESVAVDGEATYTVNFEGNGTLASA